MTPKIETANVLNWADQRVTTQWLNHVNDQSERDGATQRRMILMPRLMDHVGVPQGKIIADFGAGAGEYAQDLAKNNQMINMDINYGLMNNLSSSGSLCVQGDLSQGIPLPKNSIDIGISNLVLMWIKDLETTAAEMARVIREDGELIITVTHPSYALATVDADTDGPYMKIRGVKENDPIVKGINHGAVGPFYTYYRPIAQYIQEFAKNNFALDSSSPNYGIEEISFPKGFNHQKANQYEYALKENIPTWLLLHFRKK